MLRRGSRLRRAARRVAEGSTGGLRRITSSLRPLPDFLVIGAQRCGTTSFYEALAQHPSVRPSAVKEVHFFDVRAAQGPAWYRAQFPIAGLRPDGKRTWLTGEATPYYLFHPKVPRRALALLPEVRAIALLRDPVDRAWSHYRREVRLGNETLGFEEAIGCEEERLAEEARAFPDADRRYAAPHHRFHSYLARGRYAEQLERWLSEIPSERLLVLRSEDLYADPDGVLGEATAFLGLAAFARATLSHLQAGPEREALEPGLRARLEAYFAPHNARLYRLLGRDLGWAA